MADPRRLYFGFLAVSIPAFLYTLFYFLATEAGGAPSTFKPWLAIPIEDYFAYDRFLVAMSVYFGWILTAGVIQLLSRFFSGKGSFEDNLAAFGFGVGVASLVSLAHDLPDAILGFFGVIDMQAYEAALNSPTIWRTILWIFYSVYLIAIPALFSIGLRVAQRLRIGPAILLGLVGFLIYQLFFLLFNR